MWGQEQKTNELMEEKKLTEKESLELIAQMIQSTKENVEKGSGTTFLIWGYISTITSLLIYFIWTTTGNTLIFWSWWLIPIVGYSIEFFRRRNSPKRVVTGIDKIISKIWIVSAICCIVTPIVSAFTPIPILFVEAFIITMGTTMTGLIIKFKLVSVLGFIGIGLSYSHLFIQTDARILVFAALFILLMVIPGHVLNTIKARKAKNS